MEVEDWDRLGPFEKACWYVRQTNETLLLSCKIRISFEQMTEDLTYLKEKLEALGIPVFPKLADSVFDKKINANYINRFPPYDNWTDEHKKIFHTICDPVNRALGYKTGGLHVNEERISRNTMYNKKSFSAQVYDRLNRFFDAVLEALVGGGFHAETFHTTFTPENCKAFTLYGCRVHAAPDGLELAPAGRRRAFLLLGRGRLLFLGKGRGWKADAGYYYRGVMDAEIGPDDSAHIMCLMYNRYGILTGKRLLGRIKRRSVSLGFSFKVRGEATKFDIAVHIPPGNMPAKIKLRGFSLEKVPLQ
jgi:hypothetical protein